MSGRNDPRLDALLRRIEACRICAGVLGHEPRPVVQAGTGARILVAGQAPGRKVHESGVPWDDASGRRLREWLDIDEATFYDPQQVALVPMGFCYPGKAGSGDAPPRPECRATWHPLLLPLLPDTGLVLAIGQYAQRYHLGDRHKGSLTANLRAWREFLPGLVPLPHPSPRNVAWFKANPWFEGEVLPGVRERVRELVGRGAGSQERVERNEERVKARAGACHSPERGNPGASFPRTREPTDVHGSPRSRG